MLPVETPFKPYFDASGKSLDDGYVYFGKPNQNPLTEPVTVYWDAAGTQPAAQPLRTSNGYIMRAGTPANVFFDGSYSELVQDKHGRQVFYARTSDDFSIATVVQSFITNLASAIGASLIGFLQAGVGAIKRTVQKKLEERVSIDDFLSTPGVITQVQFDNAKTQALAVNGILTMLGSYSFSSLNIAAKNLIVECGPDTVFNHTGTGIGLRIDAGTVGSGMFNFELRGNPLIRGNLNTTDGLYIRAIHHSNIRARVTDVATGCRILFGVCTKYNITCSVNEQPFTRTPSLGIVTGERGPGEEVQDCEFYVVMEGINGTGIELNNTNGCEFRGTSEANATGITVTSTCARNIFTAVDLESNSVRDLQDYSENATYQDCLALSTGSDDNAQMVTSRGAKFIGGFWRTINLQSTSKDTLFIGVTTSDNASLGFKGPGLYKSINCVKQNTSGMVTSHIPDQIGEPNGSWTPSFSSSGGGTQGAVTNAVGTYCRLGKLCYIQGTMTIAKGSLNAGSVSISGLPFASRNTPNDFQYIGMGEWDNITLGAGYTTMCARIPPSGVVGTLIQSGNVVPSTTVNLSAFPDPMNLRFSGVYEVA